MSGFLRGFRFWRPLTFANLIITGRLDFRVADNSQYIPLVTEEF